MKTLLQFIPQLFGDYSDDLSHITDVQSKLGSIATQTSSFQNTVNVAKLVTAQTNASKFAVNMFDPISNIVDCDFDYITRTGLLATYSHVAENAKDETTEIAFNCLSNLVSKLGNGSTQEIGYYNGVPVYCSIQQVSYPSGIMYQSRFAAFFYFGRLEQNGSYVYKNPFLTIRFLPSNYDNATNVQVYTNSISDDDPWSFTADAYVEGVEVDEWFVGHIDSIINSIINDYVSNQCVSSIIQRAQTDGVITRDQVESILNQYQSTNLGESIRSLIAGTGRLDSISLIALIGKLYQKMGANHDDVNQTETFTVYNAPTFITSIIQMVLNIVLVATAIVLTVIFRVIGVIISMILSAMSTVYSLIQQNITKTNAKVIATSLTPVIDNPLMTLSFTESELTTWINKYWNDVTIDDVKAILDEFGCAMVAPAYTGSAPYYYWILPKDRDDSLGKYTVQLLISVSETYTYQSYEVANLTLSPVNIHDEDDGYGSVRVTCDSLGILLGTSGSDVSIRNGVVDAEYKYLSLSDDDDNKRLRRIINTNVMKALDDLCINASDCLVQSWGKTYLMDPSGDDAFSIVQRDPLHPEDTYIDSKKITITNALGLVTNGLNSSLFSNVPFKKIVLFTSLYTVYSRMLAADVTGVAPPTWDELTDLFNFIRDNSQYFNTFMVTKVGVYTNARLKYSELNDGHSLANPAVEWPNLSKSALIRALVISGVTIAAVAGIAVSVKVGLKRLAFNKLASRQASYNIASGKYDKMKEDIAKDKEHMGGYSKQEIKSITNDYYKANKKLTRAWSFAGKFGLSMFNGFSTGSSDNSFADDPSSSVLSNLTSNYFTQDESDPFDNINVNDIESSNVILSAIKGNF